MYMNSLEPYGFQLLINYIFEGRIKKKKKNVKAVQSLLLAVYVVITYQEEQMVQVVLGDLVVLEVLVVHQVLVAQE